MNQNILPVPADGFGYSNNYYDKNLRTYFHYLNPLPKLCFSLDMVKAMIEWQEQLKIWLNKDWPADSRPQYVVASGMLPRVFNLGGDLAYFLELIAAKNLEGLKSYGRLCVDSQWNWINSFDAPEQLTTIAMVDGTAIGGGFEAVLAADIVIAEEGVLLGLPEVNFNLFPGMGAFHLLSQRLGPCLAERFMCEGNVFTAQKLFEMGLVDVVTARGNIKSATIEFIQNDQKKLNGRQAIRSLKKKVFPITKISLQEITEHWATVALNTTQEDLTRISDLVDKQKKQQEANQLLLSVGSKWKALQIKANSYLRGP